MKELVTNHNGLLYLFRLYEGIGEIDVFKGSAGGRADYEMELGRNGLITCSCPGHKYRGECWHKGQYSKLIKKRSLKGSFAKLSEEAAKMRRDSFGTTW